VPLQPEEFLRSTVPLTKSAKRLPFTLAEELLRKHGQMRFIAHGASMLPTLLPGDELLVQRASLAELVPGDMVLFKQHARWFAHRVRLVEKNGKRPCLITRGDALGADDPPVFPEDLLGRIADFVRNDQQRRIARRQPFLARLVSAAIRHVPYVASLYLGGMRLVHRLEFPYPGRAVQIDTEPIPSSRANRKIREAA
jgi:signal peptidase I